MSFGARNFIVVTLSAILFVVIANIGYQRFKILKEYSRQAAVAAKSLTSLKEAYSERAKILTNVKIKVAGGMSVQTAALNLVQRPLLTKEDFDGFDLDLNRQNSALGTEILSWTRDSNQADRLHRLEQVEHLADVERLKYCKAAMLANALGKRWQARLFNSSVIELPIFAAEKLLAEHIEGWAVR